MDKPTQEELEGAIEWRKEIAAPIPGPFRMEMRPNIDLQEHDGSTDYAHRKIHSSFLDSFWVDILGEMRKLDEGGDEAWLRHNEQIDSRYYRDQSDRRDSIRRSGINDCIEDVKDYQAYVAESFNEIERDLADYEIEEEYELLPSIESTTVIGTGDVVGKSGFSNRRVETSLVVRCSIDGTDYDYVKQNCFDNIVIEIKDGKAFYSMVPCVYKFKKAGGI